MVEKKSQAQIIRDHINFQFDSSFDYSTKENRALDVKAIQEKYKKNVVSDYNKLKSHHAKILQEVMKKRKIDPRTMGLSKKIPRFTPPTSLDPTITPKPQPVGSGAPIQSTTEQTTATQQLATVPAPTQFQEPFIKFSETGTAATFNAFYMGIKAIFPYAKDLAPDQQKALGEMWTPIFNKYLSEKMEIVLAVIATVGIFGGQIASGRRESKKNEPKEKIENIGKPKTETKKQTTQEKAPVPSGQDEKDKLESEEISKLPDDEKWTA